MKAVSLIPVDYFDMKEQEPLGNEMISSVTANPIQHDAVQSTQRHQTKPQPKAAPSDQDSVHLSSAAKQALAASQAKPAEATETFAQTIKEAAHGDTKALAKLASSHTPRPSAK